ncbi:hypothetical protein HPB50_029003 [Hyalomma asiaticum]|nr:hypothetical protein HPB50_029003 [Hyalomma asiaticum]
MDGLPFFKLSLKKGCATTGARLADILNVLNVLLPPHQRAKFSGESLLVACSLCLPPTDMFLLHALKIVVFRSVDSVVKHELFECNRVGCHPEKCKSVHGHVTGESPCHWHELRGDMYRHLALLVHGCFQLVMRRRCTGHRARYQGLSAPQSCWGFLPGEPDVMMAPQKTTSGERPPTCRTQKERPSGRTLRKCEPVAPVQQQREVERLYVATLTYQCGTEAPRYFASGAPWKAQWRVDAAAQGAQLLAPPEAVLCVECRGKVYHGSHYKGCWHAQQARPATDDGGRTGEATMTKTPQLGNMELAALCLQRLRENPGLAAMLTPPAEPSPDLTDVGADHVLDWPIDLDIFYCCSL